MVHSALHEGNHIRPLSLYSATRAETVALPTNEKVKKYETSKLEIEYK